MNNSILFVIITSSLAILLGFLSASVTAYFKSKGQNLAMLEDQGKLTKIAEDIKKNVQKEIESVKAELNVLTNRKNQIFLEEKQALYEYYSAVSNWYHDPLSIPIGHFNSNNINEIPMQISRLKEEREKSLRTLSKIEIFVLDVNIISKAKYLFFKLNEFNNKYLDYLSETEFEIKIKEATGKENKQYLVDLKDNIYTYKQNNIEFIIKAQEEFINLTRDYLHHEN